MSNSSLVTYRYLVNNKTNGRGGKKIEKIFVHHMAGNLTVKQCGNVFRNRPASAHYGINGNAIGQYVDEKNTAWHCGNFNWNQRSIGIELANSTGAKGGWKVADSTINTAIRLIADVCKRNGISKLVYTGDMKGNLCMHRWVASTACPGPYLSKQFKRIETGVNALLGKDISKLQETIKASQKFFGTTADGWISGQVYDCRKHFQALEDAVDSWDCEGSPFVKALQKWLKVDDDGLLGKDTVTAWQKLLKNEKCYTGEIDGYFGPNSLKAWEEYLSTHDKPITEKTKPEKAVDYAKKLAADNSYRYVVWKPSDSKTKLCPICHGYTGKYKGFNCIRFVFSCWYHGGGIPCKHEGALISNAIGDKMYKVSEAEALKLAQNAIGCKDIKVMRNKKGFSDSSLQVGDACLHFEKGVYKHIYLYAGNGQMVDAGNWSNTATQIAVRKRQSCQIIVRYVGK